MPAEYLKKLSGPKPFLPIFRSPHRAEINERLFINRDNVKQVHRWLTDELGVFDISYPTLVRYKAANDDYDEADKNRRRTEVRRDLAYLGRVVKLGKETLQAGLAVRPSEAMRAIELRSYLLATFPDASTTREAKLREQLEFFGQVVKSIVTEEQRQQIVAVLQGEPIGSTKGSDDE